MLPKADCIRNALVGGVARAHLLPAGVPDSLLLEVFTPEGSGAQVVPCVQMNYCELGTVEARPLYLILITLFYCCLLFSPLLIFLFIVYTIIHITRNTRHNHSKGIGNRPN